MCAQAAAEPKSPAARVAQDQPVQHLRRFQPVPLRGEKLPVVEIEAVFQREAREKLASKQFRSLRERGEGTALQISWCP